MCTYTDYAAPADGGPNRLETALERNGFSYERADFTDNERNIWTKRLETARGLHDRYVAERREYLYYDKLIEAKRLLARFERGAAKRNIYTIARRAKNAC